VFSSRPEGLGSWDQLFLSFLDRGTNLGLDFGLDRDHFQANRDPHAYFLDFHLISLSTKCRVQLTNESNYHWIDADCWEKPLTDPGGFFPDGMHVQLGNASSQSLFLFSLVLVNWKTKTVVKVVKIDLKGFWNVEHQKYGHNLFANTNFRS